MRGNRSYFNSDTIVALSGALGGAIALVRVSGSSSKSILEKLSKKSVKEFGHRISTRTSLFSRSAKLIDDAVITAFFAPHSFTGEDCLEISIHASPWIASSLIEEVCSYGARQALPGEFSFRAVKAGKLSVNQAQAIPEIINSKNETAATLALEKLGGLQNRWVLEISEGLKKAAMLSEIGIDFSDQDIEELELSKLKIQVKQILPKLEQVEKSFKRGSQIQLGIPTAVVGLPNAGKSSFFNSLLGEDRSIVSDIPGTTRDVVRETLSLSEKGKSITLKLSDTAGIRKSDDTIEGQGIERSAKAILDSELVIWVIDSAEPSWEKIEALWKMHELESKSVIVILNKKDLLNSEQQKKLDSELKKRGAFSFVYVSSKTGEGISEAVSEIVEKSWSNIARKPGELVITNLEHLEGIRLCISDIQRALETREYELFAADIRQCLAHLSGLIGETSSDEILGKIFSEFCIGK